MWSKTFNQTLKVKKIQRAKHGLIIIPSIQPFSIPALSNPEL